MLLVLIAFSGSLYGNELSKSSSQLLEVKTYSSEYYYQTNFNNWDDWESGSFSGPDLWHQTSVDSWTDDDAMGCFRKETSHYENNMDFNYLISPTFTLEGAIDMTMDFYCKFITQDNNDNWGVVLYDPGTDSFLAHVWTAVEPWRQLPYETYGYHPTWVGPMQRMGEYQTFNIKQAYENWYNLGYFRDGHGDKIYDFRIGFVFYETDSSGVTNDIAEAHEVYWSGLYVDDVVITRYFINEDPETPNTPSGPINGRTGVTYEYTTSTTDPNGHDIRYGWDWEGDGIIDEWTDYIGSGETIKTEHSWNIADTYNVQVLAEDIYNAQSDFSDPKTVMISENNPPDKPIRPYGPAKGEAEKEYTYTTYTIDPDGDDVYYQFDWGNGITSLILGPYESEEECSASNIWFEKGNYQIKVKSIDEYGAESEWSEPLSITMPKYKFYRSEFLDKIIFRFPLIYNLYCSY